MHQSMDRMSSAIPAAASHSSSRQLSETNNNG
jgi:hypothetical protein